MSLPLRQFACSKASGALGIDRVAGLGRVHDPETELGSPLELEQHLVPADEDVRAGDRRQFEEFLVIPVTTTGKRGYFTWLTLFHETEVTLVAVYLHFRRQFKLRVVQNTVEFVECSGVGDAGDPAGFECLHDGYGIDIPPVEEIENDVGIQYKTQHGDDYNARLARVPEGFVDVSPYFACPDGRPR